MSFLLPALPGLISGGLSAGASALMGGSPSTALSGFSLPTFQAGGLKTSYDHEGMLKIRADDERMGLVNGVSNLYGLQGKNLALMRDRVAPGVSDLRKSRLGEIEDARSSAIGNLRENLARRRVLGSSFGQDTITRAESEFAGQRDRVAAESFLQELEMSNQLLNQEFEARRGQYSTKLDELNLEANLAAKLTAGATEQLGANARMQAQLDAKAAEGAGSFFGTAMRPGFNAVGQGFGDWFKGLNLGGMPATG